MGKQSCILITPTPPHKMEATHVFFEVQNMRVVSDARNGQKNGR